MVLRSNVGTRRKFERKGKSGGRSLSGLKRKSASRGKSKSGPRGRSMTRLKSKQGKVVKQSSDPRYKNRK